MNSNMKLNIRAGGIFSKYMFGIQNLTKLNSNFDRMYLNITDDRFISGNTNPFDYVLEQEFNDEFIEHDAKHMGNYSNKNPIENSNNLKNYKKSLINLNSLMN